MDIDVLRAERIAQDKMLSDPTDWDREFVLILKKGNLPVLCEWVDPYFGCFKVAGTEEVIFLKSLPSTAYVYVYDGEES